MRGSAVTRTVERFGGSGSPEAARSEHSADASMFLAGVVISLVVLYDVYRRQRAGR